MLDVVPQVLLSVLLTVVHPHGQQSAEQADALRVEGVALIAKRDFDGAIAALSKAIDPDEALTRLTEGAPIRRELDVSYYNRGHARKGKGDHDRSHR